MFCLKILSNGQMLRMELLVAGGETNSMPFDKEHLQMQIEAGGGTVLSKFDSSQVGVRVYSLVCPTPIKTESFGV